MTVDPHDVTSPKARLRELRVIHWDKWWSLALGLWKEEDAPWDFAERCVLIRWNGDEGRELGNPVSRVYPTWFVLPTDVDRAALLTITISKNKRNAFKWLEGGDPTDWEDPIDPCLKSV